MCWWRNPIWRLFLNSLIFPLCRSQFFSQNSNRVVLFSIFQFQFLDFRQIFIFYYGLCSNADSAILIVKGAVFACNGAVIWQTSFVPFDLISQSLNIILFDYIIIYELLDFIPLLLCFQLKILDLRWIIVANNRWRAVVVASQVLVRWDEINWTEVFQEGVMRWFVWVLAKLLPLWWVVRERWSCSSLAWRIHQDIWKCVGSVGSCAHWLNIAFVFNWACSFIKTGESCWFLFSLLGLGSRCTSALGVAALGCYLLLLPLAFGIALQTSRTLCSLGTCLALVTLGWDDRCVGMVLSNSSGIYAIFVLVFLWYTLWATCLMSDFGLQKELMPRVLLSHRLLRLEPLSIEHILTVLVWDLALTLVREQSLSFGKIYRTLFSWQISVWMLMFVLRCHRGRFHSWWADVVDSVFEVAWVSLLLLSWSLLGLWSNTTNSLLAAFFHVEGWRNTFDLRIWLDWGTVFCKLILQILFLLQQRYQVDTWNSLIWHPSRPLILKLRSLSSASTLILLTIIISLHHRPGIIYSTRLLCPGSRPLLHLGCLCLLQCHVSSKTDDKLIATSDWFNVLVVQVLNVSWIVLPEEWFRWHHIILLVFNLAPTELLVVVIDDDGKAFAHWDVLDVFDLCFWGWTIIICPEIEIAVVWQCSWVETSLDVADWFVDDDLFEGWGWVTTVVNEACLGGEKEWVVDSGRDLLDAFGEWFGKTHFGWSFDAVGLSVRTNR